MSDTVRDLLSRGRAAAKSGDKKEGRFFLEWVIRTGEANHEQLAEAYLWLSECTDDPAERRNCLEEVLAFDPANALARRGMAILQGRLRPEDIVDHRGPVEPAAPASTTAPGAVRRYVCPNCGGQMAYAPDRRALQCQRCGHRMWEYDAIQRGLLATGVQEQDFVATLPTARAHRWELAAVRTLTCQGCGANVTLPPALATGVCPFCGSAHVVVGQETRALLQPDGVLPFQVNADRALQLVRDWLKEQRFRPDDLHKRAMIDDPSPVYVPYWTFDFGGEVECTVIVPQNEVDDSGADLVMGLVMGSGSGFRQEVRWVPQDFSTLVDQDDFLVPASASLSTELLEKLAPFDTSNLAPYRPELLSDWPAEIYQITMADASVVAREKVLNLAKEDLKAQVVALYPNYRDPTVNGLGMVIESYKLALLPVWVSGYRYQGKRYVVAINGQTGEVVGDVPRGGVQKLLARVFGE